MSRFRFTLDMFSMGSALDNDEAARQANAALDEHLKGLKRVYCGIWSEDEPNELLCSQDKEASDTHTALLWDVEEIKPKECLHSSLRISRDGKLDCNDCGKVLEYRLVEV